MVANPMFVQVRAQFRRIDLDLADHAVRPLLAKAVGMLIGGIAGDRIGRYRIILISVLGPLPFTLCCPTPISSGPAYSLW
jgi:hypothetical protein